VPGERKISSVCRQIALEAGRHGKTIGKDPIAVEMDRTGQHPLHVFAGFLLAKGEGYQTKRGDKYRVLALCSLLPFLACSVSIWISMDAIVVLAPTNYPKRNTRRSSTKVPKPSPASELQQFFDFPDVIGNACFHCRRDAKRFMHAARVIVHEVQSDHVSVVFQLLAESVREPVDWSRKDLSQYAGIARQNGGDVRQESGPVNALFTDKQVAYSPQ